jgi:hypothetical protein
MASARSPGWTALRGKLGDLQFLGSQLVAQREIAATARFAGRPQLSPRLVSLRGTAERVEDVPCGTQWIP